MYEIGHHSSDIECPHVALRAPDGDRDELFDVRLYSEEIGNENDPTFVASRAALDALITKANETAVFRAALEHLASPNLVIRPSGEDARDMASYARRTLNSVA